MKFKKILIVTLAIVAFNVSAKNILYVEDIYTKQASKKLVKFVDSVVQEIGYTGDYELVEPKQPGIDINAWNTMVCSGVNSITHNNFMVINENWFKKLSLGAQKFLVAKVLLSFEKGDSAPVVKYIPLIFIALLYVLLALLFVILGRVKFFKDKKWWYKLGVSYLIMVTFNLTIMQRLQTKYSSYLNVKHGINLNKAVIDKMDNKDAAIEVYELYLKSIKEVAKNGEPSFNSFVSSFEKILNSLKHDDHCCNHHHS